jgi:hypothetical protein
MSDKYKNGKIYTIRCKNDDSLIYVGSTVQPLFKRWFEHKSNVNNKKSNMLLHQKIRETNIEDWYIELYEEFSCENKEQLNKREGQIIREIGTLNKVIAGRTHKEYDEDSKDKKKEYRLNYKEKITERMKEYRLNNKDKLAKQRKENRQKNKEKIKEYLENKKVKIAERMKEYQKEYRQNIKDKIKEYLENNKDKILEKNKVYYQKNQEKISEKKKEYYLKKKNNI